MPTYGRPQSSSEVESLSCHEWLTLYHFDALGRSDRRKVEKHLRHCAHCRTALIVLSEMDALIEREGGEIAGGAIEPPPALRQRILDGVRSEPQSPSGLRRPLIRVRHWLGIVIGSALALFAVWSGSLWASFDRAHRVAAVDPTR